MMLNMTFDINRPSLPFLTTAIHEGHDVRDDVRKYMEIDSDTRLYEEDICSGMLTTLCPNRIINWTSRFEVDVNRPYDKAIYRTPQDAWGLKVWNDHVPHQVFERSLRIYKAFYRHLYNCINHLLRMNGYLIIYDIHSYNLRSNDLDIFNNPEINIGTGFINQTLWKPAVDRFIEKVSDYHFLGRFLDIRENIKFKGGYMAEWIHNTFGDRVMVLSIEFRKFFMDRLGSRVDLKQVTELKNVLRSTVSSVLSEARKIIQGMTHHEANAEFVMQNR